MKHIFCNPCSISEEIPQLIAEEVLGMDNLSLLKERYQQMKEGYNFRMNNGKSCLQKI